MKRTRRVSSPPSMLWTVILAVSSLLQLLNGGNGQTCQSTLPMNLTRLLPVPTDYVFKGEDVTNYSPLNLEEGTCHVWTLQQNQLEELSCGQAPDNGKSFILIEVRRNGGNDSGPSFPLEVAVNAAFQSDGKYYLSKPFRDAAAIDYARPYHQIVVPAVIASNYTPYQWWISVANPNKGGSYFVDDYTVSASCLFDPKRMPCPKPVNGTEDCSGNGRCVPTDTPVKADELPSVQCICNGGWGDYACHKPMPSITGPDWTNITLKPGYWQYYHVQLPREYQASELLVELEALPPKSGPVPWRFLLCVKPYGPFGVPWMPDLSAYCDVTSYLLSQIHHFKVLARSMLAAQDYYIAVYHRDYSHDSMLDKAINAPPALNQPVPKLTPAQLRLRVVITQLSWPAPSPAFVCPWNCNNAGTCIEGSQTNQWNRYLGALLPFTCSCQPGFTGPLCAFAVQDLLLTLDRDTANATMTMQSGAWTQFMIKVASPVQFFNRAGLTFNIKAGLSYQNLSNPANDTANRPDNHPRPLWLRIDPPSWNPYASPFTALSQGAQVFDRIVGVNVTAPISIPYREYWWPLFYNGSLPLPGGLFVPADGILGKVSIYHNPYIDQADQDFTIQLIAKSKAVRKTRKELKNPPSKRNKPPQKDSNQPPPPLVTHTGNAANRNATISQSSNKTVILQEPQDERRQRADRARTVGFIIGVSVGCAAAALATAGWIIGQARSRRLRRQQELESQSFPRAGTPMQGDDRLAPTVRVFMGGLPALIVDTFPTYQYMPGHKHEEDQRSHSPNPVARLLRSSRSGFRRDRHLSSMSDVESHCGTPKDGKTHSMGSESDGSMRTMCTVCLDPFQAGDIVRILPCSHQFHQICIDQWLARQPSCPTCRAGFMPPNVAEMMRSIRLAQAYEQQTRLRRQMSVASAAAAAAAAAQPPRREPRNGGWLNMFGWGRLGAVLPPSDDQPLSAQAQLRTGVSERMAGLTTEERAEEGAQQVPRLDDPMGEPRVLPAAQHLPNHPLSRQPSARLNSDA